MAKEPQFQKRDLNQAAIDVIATRIDAYDKAWECRMDNLFEGIERSTAGGEEIQKFMGEMAQQQIATQHKLDTVSDDIRELTSAIREQQKSIDGHLRVAEQQQATTQELIKLVTILSSKAA